MKKLTTILFLCVSMMLTACGAAPTVPAPTAQATDSQPVTLAHTETFTPIPTDTPPAATPTQQPSRTPSAPETCPQVNEKIRAQFGSAFKDKKAAYHDIRQIVLDFLNEGGNPQTAIAKLAENGIIASQLDVTSDGVPEFLLPSGYYSIFGCHDGKYQTLLDLAPTENTGYEPVMLMIDDLNLDGSAELLIAQVLDHRVKYSLLAWDGAKFSPITPESRDGNGYIYIEQHDIYAAGQSHAEAGKINGNWQVTDTNGDGIQEISIKAGIDTSFSSANVEEQITLSWNGNIYGVISNTIEATRTATKPPTPLPTFTPVPFSSTCDFQVSDVWYNPISGDSDRKQSVEDFLNAGGNPEKLQPFFDTKILDLTNDGVKDVLVSSDTGYVYVFKCVNGIYQQQFHFPFDRKTFALTAATVQDINKNGIPEIFSKSTACFDINSINCGVIYIAEWDKSNGFQGLIKDRSDPKQLDYAITNNRQETYLKDFDGDNIFEIVWVGGIPLEYEDQSGLPWRLETHIYKWDGQYYSAQLVEHSSPIYHFQAVQDGDRYALDGQYEKALKSYKNAIENNLGWWTEDRQIYLLGQAGKGQCSIKDGRKCSPPTLDPNEKPLLQAYATYRSILTQILLGKPDTAEKTYNTLISTYPSGNPAYPVVELATAFWEEYQASKNMGTACAQAIDYAENHKDILAYIGSDYHGWQMQTYKPVDICPFK